MTPVVIIPHMDVLIRGDKSMVPSHMGLGTRDMTNHMYKSTGMPLVTPRRLTLPNTYSTLLSNRRTAAIPVPPNRPIHLRSRPTHKYKRKRLSHSCSHRFRLGKLCTLWVRQPRLSSSPYKIPCSRSHRRRCSPRLRHKSNSKGSLSPSLNRKGSSSQLPKPPHSRSRGRRTFMTQTLLTRTRTCRRGHSIMLRVETTLRVRYTSYQFLA